MLVAHGVGPLVYAAHPFPALRAEAIRAATLEPLREEDLRALLGILEAKGIPLLITKGTALAYHLYAAPEFRPRADVDLLVALQDAPAAIGALTAAGYHEQPGSGDEHAVRQVTLTHVDRYGFRHTYDLHWAITNTPVFSSVLRFEELLPRAVPLSQLGPAAFGLSAVDALLLACIHRVAHHHDDDRLIWLVDIARLLERMSPEELRSFWTSAANAGVVGVCMRSVALAGEWIPLSDSSRAEAWLTAEQLGRPEPSRAFLAREISYGMVTWANFRALPWKARWQRLWQLAFPPPDFVRSTFKSSSTLALPWLYLWRGARGVARLFRRMP